MEQQRFDRIAAALGGAATRRAGLKAAAAALLGFGVEAQSVPGQDVAAASRHEPGRIRTRTQEQVDDSGDAYDEKRPCGPTAKENRCRKHKDCCTRYCRKKKGHGGRCRCIRVGKACKARQQCCGAASCQNKKCTAAKPPIPPAPPCMVCASGCQFTSVNDAYAAAAAGGTITIGSGSHPTGITITKDITLEACTGVTDATLVWDGVQKLSGQDSYSLIIAEDDAGVTRHSVTLRNLTFEANFPDSYSNDQKYSAALYSGRQGLLDFTIDGCTFTKLYYGLYPAQGTVGITNSLFDGNAYGINWSSSKDTTLSLTDTTFTNTSNLGYSVYFEGDDSYTATVTISGCHFDANAAYIYLEMNTSDTPADRARHTATITNSTFNNNIDSDYGFGLQIKGGVTTITDCEIKGNSQSGLKIQAGDVTVTGTPISGNSGKTDPVLSATTGGGILIDAYFHDAKLTFGAGTTVTGNTAQYGSGIFVNEVGGYSVTMSGVNSSSVYGNLTGPNCSSWDRVSTPPPTEVVNCSF